MEMLTLNHVLEAEGVHPEDVLVIRHSKTDGRLPEVMRSGTLRIFSGVQNPRESPWSEEITGGHGLWLVFVGIRDRYTSRLEGVYRHEPGGGIVEKGMLPDSYPETGSDTVRIGCFRCGIRMFCMIMLDGCSSTGRRNGRPSKSSQA